MFPTTFSGLTLTSPPPLGTKYTKFTASYAPSISYSLSVLHTTGLTPHHPTPNNNKVNPSQIR
jgi:hypothetical protein